MASGTETIGKGPVFSAPWVGRAAAFGILIGLLLLIYALFIVPMITAYAEINGATAESAELLGRYQRIIAQHSVLQEKLDSANQKHTQSGVYVPGDTDALAAAQLQEIVNSRVESNGGQVRSVQILPAKEDGDFRRVGVRVQMTASIAAVARILYGFEAGDTFLFVDNLDISNRQSRRRLAGGQQTDPQLLVRLDLTGYVRPESAR